MNKLKEKTALVTGGASGIGFGMVEAFLEQGMNVIIADVREDHLNQAREALVGRNDVHFLLLDVTNRPAMAAAAKEVKNVFGKLHVLCNNAGVGPMTSVNQCSYDDWDWCLDVNMNGVFNGLHNFLPLIQAHEEGGHIVNTASVAAGLPMDFAYTASKCGVLGVTEGIAEELATMNIGATCLMPGPVKTNIHEIAKLRPARYSDTPLAEAEAQMAQRKAPDHWLAPIVVGRMVVDAIQRNLLYIFTHKEFADGIRKRHEAILAALPVGEVTQAEKDNMGFAVENPIHDRLIKVSPASAESIKIQLQKEKL